MTFIAGQGLPALLNVGSSQLATEETPADELPGTESASFMMLLQQATAVLPQALQAIRDELPAAAAEQVGEMGAAPVPITPESLLEQLAAAAVSPDAGLAEDAGSDSVMALAGARALISLDALEAAPAPADAALVELPEINHASAAGLTAASTTATSTATASAHSQIQSPVGSKGWAEEIGARLTVLGARGEHTASLRLSPEHLGPLEVRITIQDDKASVWFGAAHAQTREAIEQALPRLREMLQSEGLTLDEAGVFDDSPSRSFAGSAAGGAHSEGDVQDEPLQLLHHQGLLDLYA